MSFVKSDLIKELSKDFPNFLKKDLVKLFDIMIYEMKESLKRGERIELRDIFTIEPRVQKARVSRNPKTNQKVERIENNTFGYCLIIIIRKLYIKEINISQYLDEIFDYSIIHWSIIQGFNEKIYKRKYNILKELWLKNKYLALSIDKESLIDLIIELYKSFEIGVGNKKIIKENIAALIYSVSKANKEFRMDALKEIKKVLNIL